MAFLKLSLSQLMDNKPKRQTAHPSQGFYFAGILIHDGQTKELPLRPPVCPNSAQSLFYLSAFGSYSLIIELRLPAVAPILLNLPSYHRIYHRGVSKDIMCLFDGSIVTKTDMSDFSKSILVYIFGVGNNY